MLTCLIWLSGGEDTQTGGIVNTMAALAQAAQPELLLTPDAGTLYVLEDVGKSSVLLRIAPMSCW